jgi:hypothetical protein
LIKTRASTQNNSLKDLSESYSQSKTKKRIKKIPTAILVCILILAVVTAFSWLIKPLTQQPPYQKAAGQYVYLINNSNSQNPTWSELCTFLVADKTVEITYAEKTWACADYAEKLHNNAEAAGIKAAWVAIDFQNERIGHAANAFNTTDRGLVYIDCTGKQLFQQINLAALSYPGDYKRYGISYHSDKVAYIQKGGIYGVVSLDSAYGVQYSDYEKWSQDKILFESKIAAYKTQLDGRQSVNSSEYQDLKRQEKEIDQLGFKLGGFWEPLGIVTDVKVYW